MAAANTLTPVVNTPVGAAGTNSAISFVIGGVGTPLEQFMTCSLGTFTLNGTTAVTVTDAGVNLTSVIIFSLNTVGGTVGADVPGVKTITAGTGFTVAGTASDTSIYNYLRLG